MRLPLTKSASIDYNDNPPNATSFMSVIVSTSRRLHSEFVCLLFLQTHRETDRFFAVSTVQLPQSNRGQPVPLPSCGVLLNP